MENDEVLWGGATVQADLEATKDEEHESILQVEKELLDRSSKKEACEMVDGQQEPITQCASIGCLLSPMTGMQITEVIAEWHHGPTGQCSKHDVPVLQQPCFAFCSMTIRFAYDGQCLCVSSAGMKQYVLRRAQRNYGTAFRRSRIFICLLQRRALLKSVMLEVLARATLKAQARLCLSNRF
jgi:hypothetical protein